MLPVHLMCVQAACLAKDAVVLKRLREEIQVCTADASDTLPNAEATAAGEGPRKVVDAFFTSLPGQSTVFLVAQGGVQVWRRDRLQWTATSEEHVAGTTDCSAAASTVVAHVQHAAGSGIWTTLGE